MTLHETMKTLYGQQTVFLCLLCSICCTSSLDTILGFEERTASACFSHRDKTMSMTCDPGHMVRVVQVRYGYTADAADCHQTKDDCVMTLPEPERYACIGRQQCDINLPSGGKGRYLPRCYHFSTRMEIRYQCIPRIQVADVCQNVTLTHQRGFVATPRYPNNYPNSLHCPLRIQLARRADNTRQRIKLHIIDMDLEANGTGCSDWLNTFDGFRSNTICSGRAEQDVLTTLEHHLVLTLHTNGEQRQKGFWLYYEASPLIDSNSEMPSKARPNHGNTPQSNKMSTTDIHVSCIQRSPMFIGVVVALVTSATLSVILALTSVILLKRNNVRHSTLTSASRCSPKQMHRVTKMSNVWYINNAIIPLPTSYIDRDRATGEEQLYC